MYWTQEGGGSLTLIITLYTPEGIVMASDSRSTFQNQEEMTSETGQTIQRVNFGVHITDTVYKTFVTDNHVGISTCGDSSINGTHITGYIEAFIREHQTEDIIHLSDELLKYFKSLCPNNNTTFHVSGYTEEGECVLYTIDIARDLIERIDTSSSGATWSGQSDILSRLLNSVAIIDNGVTHPLPPSPILWNYFSLQDAVEFAEYAIKTTIDSLHFMNRVKTVGGPIDILIIKPGSHRWLARKKLHTSSCMEMSDDEFI